MSDGADDIAQIHFNPRNCLIENNIFYDGGDLQAGGGFKMNAGFRNIIRKNVIYDCAGHGLEGYTKEKPGIKIDVSYCKWYHNTVYDCGSGGSMEAGFRFMAYADTIHEIHHNMVKNNIFHTSNKYGLYVSANPGWDAYVHDNLLEHNIVYNSQTNDVVYMRVGYTMAQAQSNFPSIFQNNTTIAPLFVNPENADFRLQEGSPAIGTASNLTKTINSGNGTQVSVDDAGYFCDGFGLINGDQITIGSNPPVMITNVNYDNNIITVDQSIAWNNEDPVFLTGCYDIGAVQSGTEPDCINPDGWEGNIICGNPNHGQNPLNHYQCQCVGDICNWIDLGYSSDCDIPPPPPQIPIWIWPLLFGGAILGGAIIYKIVKKKR